MHPGSVDDAARLAYVASVQAFAAMAVRNLLALEGDDPDIGSVMVECSAEGGVAVTLVGPSGHPVGGYSL
jgi:5,10-methylenetetrahydrofolate reductase